MTTSTTTPRPVTDDRPLDTGSRFYEIARMKARIARREAARRKSLGTVPARRAA